MAKYFHFRDVTCESCRRLRSQLLLSLVCLVVLALSSCTGNTKQGSLKSYLLSPTDLDVKGWSVDAFSNVEEPGLCGKSEAEAFRGQGENAVATVLRSADSRVAVTELLLQRDDRAAALLMDEVRQQLGMCREYSATSGHVTTRRVLTDLPVPKLGDESLAYRETWLDVPLDGHETIDTALYRRGAVVMILVSSSIDPETLLVGAIEKGYHKLDPLVAP